jgi:hypothetical protein
LLTAGLLLPPTASAHAQTAIAVVEEVAFEPLRAQCSDLLKSLDAERAPLPPEVARELNGILANGAKDPEAAAVRIQQLLDARCLIAVNINPESRVKAARGPAAADLIRDRPVIALVKVHNEAGVTHPLVVTGPQVLGRGKDGHGRWLEAMVPAERGRTKPLTGQKVEYVPLRLTAHEAGKREATLRFDVGQGTQDLGFRAEVPVLFTIKEGR